MAKPFPLNPKHPERICWGCDRYCAAHDLACGNGADRTMHPAEMLGDDWYLHGDWGIAAPLGAERSSAADVTSIRLQPLAS
ncbi:DUF3079 domain-containing protein [Pseudomonas sp. UL073]|uniref:DUF3079 domain-containing protein n=1 Tax=Zestomonas insulae TaxID=2809017 RepID=A0ABS2IBI4_9GAMM|nr:DUF3079 domain-containing protein [Pseudomonas insulae]MBM7060135.1 DUF3079 domain-containing protein [Pseudomonas insulae]